MSLKKNVIIYPIFIECSEYSDDIFWKNIFNDLAYGKCPYGTYFSKDYLCCSYKKKEFSYKIEGNDAKCMYDDIYKLLNGKLNICSPNELIYKQQIFEDVEDNIKDKRSKWSSIKKKAIKDLIIEMYVKNMKKNNNLTYKQVEYLLSIIRTGFIFKIITADDIIYKNGNIISINGISFKNNKIVIDQDIYNFKVNHTSNINIEKKLMSDNWEKYLLKKNT